MQQDNAPAHRAGDTVEFLSRSTPDFISPLLWPPNSPDLNPLHYEVWGVLQQSVYRGRIRDFDHLKQRLIEEWRCFDQNIIDRAVRQWRVRLRPLWAQTVTDVFVYKLLRRLFVPYWKLLFLSSIFKTAVAQKLILLKFATFTSEKWQLKPLRGYLILIRYAVVIVIWILASLFWNTVYFYNPCALVLNKMRNKHTVNVHKRPQSGHVFHVLLMMYSCARHWWINLQKILVVLPWLDIIEEYGVPQKYLWERRSPRSSSTTPLVLTVELWSWLYTLL